MFFSLMAFAGVGSAAYDSTRQFLPLCESSMSLIDDVVMSRPSNGFFLFPKTTYFPLQISAI